MHSLAVDVSVAAWPDRPHHLSDGGRIDMVAQAKCVVILNGQLVVLGVGTLVGKGVCVSKRGNLPLLRHPV